MESYKDLHCLWVSNLQSYKVHLVRKKKKQREPLHPRAVFNAVLVSETVNNYLQPEGDGSEGQLTE